MTYLLRRASVLPLALFLITTLSIGSAVARDLSAPEVVKSCCSGGCEEGGACPAEGCDCGEKCECADCGCKDCACQDCGCKDCDCKACDCCEGGCDGGCGGDKK